MKQNTAIRAWLYIPLTIAAIVSIIPFLWMFFGSFKSQGEFIADPGAWLPETLGNTSNYWNLFASEGFAQFLANSLIVAAVVVLGNVVLATMAGYGLAKISFQGRGFVMVLVVGAMTIPGVGLFVPQFLVAMQLHLVDTLAGIAAPLLVMPLSVFIARQFALSVPDELLEAARIDGAGELRIFATIFFPLSGPALATTAVLSFLASWNNFIWPLVVAQSESKYTLPVGLAIASEEVNTVDYGIMLAGAVVILAPVLILFLFLQRYFIRGLATTGLK